MTDRRRRSHPAAGTRWLTCGLAAAGTTTMIGHLQTHQPPVPNDQIATAAAPRAEPATPPTTIVTVIQVRRRVVGPPIATIPTPPPAARVAVPAAPAAPAARPAHRRVATTRVSG